MKRLALLMALAAGPAAAHPHIFIDAGVEVIYDAAGQATHLRISWTYDDFYSLVMIEERGLDADHDGTLTAEEEARLNGFDMAWDADFAGDTYALGPQEAALALSRPEGWTARYAEGRITSTHLRAFAAPVPRGTPITVQVYDPGYYTAYTITAEPVLTGAPAGCSAEIWRADRDAADAILADAIAEYTADGSLEGDFPAVGSAYADEVRVTCPDS